VPTQFKSFFLDTFIYTKYKWLSFLLLSFLTSIFGGIYSYPKTDLTIAVHTHYLELLDKDGQIKSDFHNDEIYKLQNRLKQSGIKLNLKAQESNKNEKAVLEFLIDKPQQLDFTKYLNLGQKLPNHITSQFNSVGIVGLVPYFFLVKKNQKNIQSLKDLKGKKLLFGHLPKEEKILYLQKVGTRPLFIRMT
jgi:hypothetical protein